MRNEFVSLLVSALALSLFVGARCKPSSSSGETPQPAPRKTAERESGAPAAKKGSAAKSSKPPWERGDSSKDEEASNEARPADDGPERSEPESAKTATTSGTEVSFTVIGGGMIHLKQKGSTRVPDGGFGRERKISVIRTGKGLRDLISRVPPKTITKGPGRPNPDPMLKKPAVDFSQKMVIVVEYDYMWKKPTIKKVTLGGDKLQVKAKFANIRGIMQHAGGVGSYVAITVPKSKHPAVLASQP
jgi:hypothetical protein